MAGKWTKSQRIKFENTMHKRNQTVRHTSVAKLPRLKVPTPTVLDSAYAGEQSSVDVNRIEDRAFRRGLFTGLQMVVDLLIRELR